MFTIIFFIIVIFLLILNFCRETTPVEIYCKSDTLKNKLLKSIPSLKGFKPTCWASKSCFQTCLRLLDGNSLLKTTSVRTYIERYDGGLVSLDWIQGNNAKPSYNSDDPCKPILLVIPSAFYQNSKFYTRLHINAIEKGFIPIVFNRRGYSSTPLTNDVILPFSDTSDLQACIEYIRASRPFSDICAIGYSLDSTSLINYLQKSGCYGDIEAAVCISPVFNSHDIISRIKKSSKYILNGILKQVMQGSTILSKAIELDANDLSLFNYMCTGPYSGIVKSGLYSSGIRVPTMFINSLDDPVIKRQTTLLFEFLYRRMETCILVNTVGGGHCGFYKNIWPASWADEIAVDFLTSVLKNRAQFSSLYENSSVIKRSHTLN